MDTGPEKLHTVSASLQPKTRRFIFMQAEDMPEEFGCRIVGPMSTAAAALAAWVV
jgi:hypothetical protein